MKRLLADVRVRVILIVGLVVALVVVGLAVAGRQPGPYHETFDAQGSWGLYGSYSPEGSGAVDEGVYLMQVPLPRQRAWAATKQWYGDALYSVEVTQREGPLRNGHGLIWRVDEHRERFYYFVISSDGIYSAGYCVNACLGEERNMTQGWLPTDVIRTGLGQTNTIAVRAEGPDNTFFINDTAVWQATDVKFAEGDVGLILETYEQGGVVVAFDNFRVEPLE
ncbi:MAG: hypothetical protein M5R40_09750 [Anaerolineae bacterium]|nr:hypothetical protein [Anaerolineae bacterium]